MKILVGVDFTKSSENAIALAALWGRKFIAELVLVHAYLPPVVDPSIPVGILEVSQMNLAKEYEESLQKKAREIQETGVTCSYKVMVGDLKYAIKEIKDEMGADLLILGRTTNPDFIDRIMGSTSQHLINDLDLPLLVIPDSFTPEMPRSVAYDTSLEFNETPQLLAVKNITDRFKASISFVKVILDDDLDINPDKAFISEIKSIFGEESSINEIEAKDLKSGINKFIQETDANLLVLTSHKRGLLDGLLAPSQSKKMLTRFDIPILIYHF